MPDNGNFVENRRRRKAAQDEAPQPITGTTLAVNGNGAYVGAAHCAEIAELTECPQGNRNHVLNVVALKLARLPIDRDELRNDLIQACLANGLIRDDGRASVEATIRSAFTKADVDGPRPIPEQRNGFQVTEVDAATLAPAGDHDESRDLHQIAVTRRAYEFRVNDEARALWTRQRAVLSGQQRPALVNLVDMLAVPDEDATYRINDLLPVGGRALLAAQYKAGKTSMVANLLRALVDGSRFLMRFQVTAVPKVVLIDTELDERMLRRWLRDQNVRNPAAIDVLCLRGRLSSFDIVNDTTRAEWAAALAGADFVILDCLRPCLDALGLSEDKEAGIFLTAFDSLCREAGAAEAVVVHHMGHGQERSRGDSRLLDWPDVLWKIVRDDPDSDSGDRFFSAIGRDVNVPESRLEWTPHDRSLTLLDGGRADKRARETGVDIIDILTDPANSAGLSNNQLVAKLKAFGTSRDRARRAVRMAVDDGLLLTAEGPRSSTVYTLNPSRRP